MAWLLFEPSSGAGQPMQIFRPIKAFIRYNCHNNKLSISGIHQIV